MELWKRSMVQPWRKIYAHSCRLYTTCKLCLRNRAMLTWNNGHAIQKRPNSSIDLINWNKWLLFPNYHSHLLGLRFRKSVGYQLEAVHREWTFIRDLNWRKWSNNCRYWCLGFRTCRIYTNFGVFWLEWLGKAERSFLERKIRRGSTAIDFLTINSNVVLCVLYSHFM